MVGHRGHRVGVGECRQGRLVGQRQWLKLRRVGGEDRRRAHLGAHAQPHRGLPGPSALGQQAGHARHQLVGSAVSPSRAENADYTSYGVARTPYTSRLATRCTRSRTGPKPTATTAVAVIENPRLGSPVGPRSGPAGGSVVWLASLWGRPGRPAGQARHPRRAGGPLATVLSVGVNRRLHRISVG